MENRRVVITGVSTVTALGLNITEYWKKLVNGACGFSEISFFDPSKYNTKYAGEIRADIAGLLKSKFSTLKVHKLERVAAIGLYAVINALDDAGINYTSSLCSDMGVVIGS
jgi:3-oxoacyl-[acyl-carrier-protein] synthase II